MLRHETFFAELLCISYIIRAVACVLSYGFKIVRYGRCSMLKLVLIHTKSKQIIPIKYANKNS